MACVVRQAHHEGSGDHVGGLETERSSLQQPLILSLSKGEGCLAFHLAGA